MDEDAGIGDDCATGLRRASPLSAETAHEVKSETTASSAETAHDVEVASHDDSASRADTISNADTSHGDMVSRDTGPVRSSSMEVEVGLPRT